MTEQALFRGGGRAGGNSAQRNLRLGAQGASGSSGSIVEPTSPWI
jgi:hypothetical protein